MDAYEIAAARERPPSPTLLRHAEWAYSTAARSARPRSRGALLPGRRRERAGHSGRGSARSVDGELAGRARLPAGSARRCRCSRTAGGDIDRRYRRRLCARRPLDSKRGLVPDLSEPTPYGNWGASTRPRRRRERSGSAVENPVRPGSRAAAKGAPWSSRRWSNSMPATSTPHEPRSKPGSVSPVNGKTMAGFAIAYARVLLADGRAAEAIEPLRLNYGNWLSYEPEHPLCRRSLVLVRPGVSRDGRQARATDDRAGETGARQVAGGNAPCARRPARFATLKVGATADIAHACVFRPNCCRLAPLEPVAGGSARARGC